MSKHQMSKRCCYRFAYTVPGHKDRELQPFQLRDGEAASHMLRAIEARGYAYEGSIVNYPSPGPDLIPMDVSRLRPTDLILFTTRPPMDDLDIRDRKIIHRSFTTLEEDIFRALRPYFTRCARSEVLLTDEIAGISPEIATRQSCEFRQNCGAAYSAYGPRMTRDWRLFKDDPRPPTAAFLVHLEHVWPGGPGLLLAFGMGGVETLVWTYHLARRFSHLLFTSSFVMAELRAPRLAEPPVWMDFAEAWDVQILGVAKSTPGPQARGRDRRSPTNVISMPSRRREEGVRRPPLH